MGIPTSSPQDKSNDSGKFAMSSSGSSEDNLKNKIGVMQKALLGYVIYQRPRGDNKWYRIDFTNADTLSWNFDDFEYKADRMYEHKYNAKSDLLGREISREDDLSVKLLIVAQDNVGVYIGTSPFVITYKDLELDFIVKADDY
jgi:hypothetical protein